MVLKYLKRGMKVSCKIEGMQLDGIIQIETHSCFNSKRYFICQNFKEGLSINNKMGMKYSWAINTYEDYSDLMGMSSAQFKEYLNKFKVTDLKIKSSSKCQFCGKKISNFEFYQGEPVCEECAEEMYHCAYCGNLMSEDEGTLTSDTEEVYCNECINHLYKCEECGEFFAQRDSVQCGGMIICNDCFENGYAYCDDCGDIFCHDDLNFTDDGAYCNGCYDERGQDERDYRGYRRGTHNGIVNNYLSIDHKVNVDSEVIFKLLNESGNNFDVFKRLSGSFAISWTDNKNLYLVRDGNPLSMFYLKSLDTMFYISLENYILPIVYGVLKEYPKIIELEEDKVYILNNANSYIVKPTEFYNDYQYRKDYYKGYEQYEDSVYPDQSDTYYNNLIKYTYENSRCEYCGRDLSKKEGFWMNYDTGGACCNSCACSDCVDSTYIDYISPDDIKLAMRGGGR